MSTLRFAERIKLVKIKAKMNISLDPVAEIKKEMEEMRQRMQDEIEELKRRAEGKGDPAELENLRRVLEEQKVSERQLREDYEKNKSNLLLSDADKKKQNDAQAKLISEQWKNALGGASLEKKEAIKVPHLLNLNEDPRLAETLIYTFKQGKTVIGRGDKANPPDIEFNGMGIIKGHCTVEWDGEKSLKLIPSAQGACLINGKRVTEPTVLKHNSRVWLGNNYAFRLGFPTNEAEGEKVDQTPDYLSAEAEIAEVAAQAAASAGVAGIPSGLSHKLSEALKKVEQANIIATDLHRDNVFSPKIIKNRITGDDMVVVQVMLPGGLGELTWPWDKFNVRLVEMVKLWQEWQFAVQNEQTFVNRPDEENPFVDNEHQLVGEADVWLQSLGNMIEHDAQASILAPTGQCIGHLQLEINPLDKNGNEGPWDDDNADLDPFVEDPSQLLDSKIQFIIKINKAIFDVDLKAGNGQCKYCDTFVRYRVDYSNESEEPTQTTKVSACTVEAVYSSTKKHSLQVTPSVLNLLRKDRLVFQVFGKVASNKFSDWKEKNAGRLPPGWKRVTAFEDPSGALHHTLPPL
jgi:hypothetical protein